jgi:hypothetical protein
MCDEQIDNSLTKMLGGNTQKIGEERLVNGGRPYVCGGGGIDAGCWILDAE